MIARVLITIGIALYAIADPILEINDTSEGLLGRYAASTLVTTLELSHVATATGFAMRSRRAHLHISRVRIQPRFQGENGGERGSNLPA